MMVRMIVNIYSGLPLGGTTMRMIVNIYSGFPLEGTTEIQKEKTDSKDCEFGTGGVSGPLKP